ncbi:unannotated protein [freshwater metagenome]|uniref:Unannotated protein n=1 Tax=freshwater metagenome TaxID=449393 RepID=A0A6J6ZU70_9ZZZZ
MTPVVKILLPVLIPPVVINKESAVVPNAVPLTIVDADAKVIWPTNVFIPAGLLIAPKLLIPVPLIVKVSGIVNPLPFIFNAAVFTTVVVEAPVTPALVLPNPS